MLARRRRARHRHRRLRGRPRTRLHHLRASWRGRCTPATACCSTTAASSCRVEGTDGVTIRTRVVNGGPLGEHKGINAPRVALPSGALTLKDADDLAVRPVARRRPGGAQLRAVGRRPARSARAHRRVARRARRAAHRQARAAGGDRRGSTRSSTVADAVMVARGDLGLEVPFAQVPRVQKDILRTARARGVPAIVATQVLESMREEPRPTRAEVSDAASAVDWAPPRSCWPARRRSGTLSRCGRCRRSTRSSATPKPTARGRRRRCRVTSTATARGITRRRWPTPPSALATRAHAGAIVAVTREGRTARMLSSGPSRRHRVCRHRSPRSGAAPGAVVGRRRRWSSRSTATSIRWRPGWWITCAASGRSRASSTAVIVNVSPDLDRGAANFVRIRRA